MCFAKTPLNFLIAIFFTVMFSLSGKPKEAPLNILFIAVDDLRPELSCYGKSYIHSPNIDALAKQGSIFMNHFVTVPTCGASRHGMLTGKYPNSKNDINNNASVLAFSYSRNNQIPETFIHKLKLNNYYTVGIGKISHHPDGLVYPYLGSPKDALLELPNSWDEMLFNSGKWGTGHNAFFGYSDGTNRNTLKGQVKPYENAQIDDDEGLPDGLTANLAIEKIKDLKNKKQPFFLAVGFFKPHLPFVAPKKYWDIYKEEDIELTPTPFIPKGSSPLSLQNSGEFNQYELGEEKASLNENLSDDYSRKLKHAYFASVSYVDAQIGKVIAALEENGLAENTVIILWGDHGWHLGDQMVWGKHTLFEPALNSPLIIKSPRQKYKGEVANIVSSVDIYPTILELAKLKSDIKLDGVSLVRFLKKGKDKHWKDEAFSYFNNGFSLRTKQYRITEYFRNKQTVFELYDIKKDPNQQKNIISNNEGLLDELKIKLHKGYKNFYNNP